MRVPHSSEPAVAGELEWGFSPFGGPVTLVLRPCRFSLPPPSRCTIPEPWGVSPAGESIGAGTRIMIVLILHRCGQLRRLYLPRPDNPGLPRGLLEGS